MLTESIKKKSDDIHAFQVWKANTNKDWIQTYTGLKFHANNPAIEEISIRDIAHQLSFCCRFAGTTPLFYSVAQHSVLTYEILLELQITDPKILLQGLLHDAAEAYIGDLPSPIKKLIPEYVALENRIIKVIGKAFDLDLIKSPIVERADAIALAMEYRDLRPQIYDWDLKEKALTFKKVSPKSNILNEIEFLKIFKNLNKIK